MVEKENQTKEEEIKKICKQINSTSLFESIYNPDGSYSSERRLLELLRLLNSTIKSLWKFIKLYDASELQHQHDDLETGHFQDIALGLEDARSELFSDSLNWDRVVELGMKNLPRVEGLNLELKKLEETNDD